MPEEVDPETELAEGDAGREEERAEWNGEGGCERCALLACAFWCEVDVVGCLEGDGE